MLIALAGLPGSGKSHLADALARSLDAVVVSVDPIEDAVLRSGVDAGQPTGLAAYLVAEAIAANQLRLGRVVVLDAVNAVEPARGQWRDLAAQTGVDLLFVEIVCSDLTLHRRRLEGRERGFGALPEPTWTSVLEPSDDFEPWRDEHLLVLDTNQPTAELVSAVLSALSHDAAPKVSRIRR